MRDDRIDSVLAFLIAGVMLVVPALTTTAQTEPVPIDPPEARQLVPDQPDAEPDADAPEPGGDLDSPFEFGPFAEPMEITAFVEYVADTLHINITRDASLSGQVAFNAGVEITKRDLLPLLDARLEELGYTVTLDSTGFYTIRKLDQISVNPSGDEMGTTRFIPTPGVRPSSLRSMVSTQLGIAQQVNPGNVQRGTRISYEDELGVIIVTDSPRRIAALESLIAQILEHRAELVTKTIELKYVSAPQALSRARRLLSGSSSTPSLSAQLNQINNGINTANTANQNGSMASLTNRLSIDSAGNSLIFRGLPDEFEEIQQVIAQVDRQSQLVPKSYFTGSSTKAIADFADQRGFGSYKVTEQAQQGPQFLRNQQQINFPGLDSGDEDTGGSQMLVDETRGTIIYYATPEQHEAFAKLVDEINAKDEEIVVQTYKLEYADAEEVADLLQSLIERTRPQTEASAFLPNAQQNQQTPRPLTNPNRPVQPEGDGTGPQGFGATPEESFVLADPANNQVVIRAPRQQQQEFKLLIHRIDLRRAQVYIEATIVAVSDTDSFRLAIESQFPDLNGSGEGGGVRSNFGLSTLDAFTNSVAVGTGLGGVTAALIKDDYVPFIINATQSDQNSRVVATPQLLVDDNSEAEVLTSQEVPFQTTTASNVSERTTFEFTSAETRLTVTPKISSGGTVQLDYEIVLEAFTGAALNGAPPPKQTNNIRGDAVTVPSDSTVVIGGLLVKSEGKTVLRVPLLGDIPLVGHLFRDTNTNGRDTTLYVFLKPRVLKNPNIRDYMLLTEGPQKASGLKYDIPEFPPIIMESTYVLREDDEPRIGLPSERDPDLDQSDLLRDRK